MQKLFFFPILIALMLVGCGAKSSTLDEIASTKATEVSETAEKTIVAEESPIIGVQKGNPDAVVTLVEYFSPTCGACQQFHQNLMPMIQSEYIDTGKIIFEYRDYPLNQIDIAAYALARCSAEDDGYFKLIDDFFQNQAGIREAVSAGQGKVALETLAKRHGITDAEAFDACVNNEEIREAISRSAKSGQDAGVTGTPSFLLNGNLVSYSEFYSEQQARVLLELAIGTATTDDGATANDNDAAIQEDMVEAIEPTTIE